MTVCCDVALSSLNPVTREQLTHRLDDGGGEHLWNVGKRLPGCTAQHYIFLLAAVRPWTSPCMLKKQRVNWIHMTQVTVQ
jgi:hypothetical protein